MAREDQVSVSALVEQKLAEADGEYLVFALRTALSRPRTSFEEFAA